MYAAKQLCLGGVKLDFFQRYDSSTINWLFAIVNIYANNFCSAANISRKSLLKELILDGLIGISLGFLTHTLSNPS